jgi:hypothetical protein
MTAGVGRPPSGVLLAKGRRSAGVHTAVPVSSYSCEGTNRLVYIFADMLLLCRRPRRLRRPWRRRLWRPWRRLWRRQRLRRRLPAGRRRLRWRLPEWRLPSAGRRWRIRRRRLLNNLADSAGELVPEAKRGGPSKLCVRGCDDALLGWIEMPDVDACCEVVWLPLCRDNHRV